MRDVIEYIQILASKRQISRMSLKMKEICKENRIVLKISPGFHRRYFQHEHTFKY